MEDKKDDIFEELFEINQLINLGMIEEWEMIWQMCIIQLTCFIMHAMHLLTMQAILICAPSDGGDSERDQLLGNMSAYSLGCGNSTQSQENQSQGISSSKGTKRKASMIDFVESGYEKMNFGINNLIEVMQEGITLANKRVEITKEGLAIIERSKPQYYSPADVWNELDNIGVMQDLRFQCYHFLCENENAKRQFFGVPQEKRWNFLCYLMKEAKIF